MGVLATILSGVILIALILVVGLYLYYKKSYGFWARKGVQVVPPEFIYGSFKQSVTMKIAFGQDMAEWYTETKAKGLKYIGTYFFWQPILLVCDTEIVKNVMGRDFNHFVDRGVVFDEESDPLSAHLFSLTGQKWRKLRQKLTPTFTSGKLKKMFSTLVKCTEDLEDCLDVFISKDEPVNIKQILVKYTTDVIGSCAFGIDCKSFENPNSDFIRIGHKIFNPEMKDRVKMFASIFFPALIKLFKVRVTNKEVDQFFRSLVKDTIQYRENNNISRNDFMQLLIQLKNKGVLDDDEESSEETVGTTLTLNEATAQAFIFFVAGFETSSTTMTFCFLELAKNPEIQEKARNEVVKVLKKHGGEVTYEALREMHYLEKVIQETLRKHPPIMNLQRVVTEEYTVPETGLVLEKGTGVFVPVLGIHMDPEIYPEPEVFDPERFNEENKASRPDYTFLPFGDGPRVCIGLRFGMMQTKVGICKLLCNYKFSLNPKTSDPIVIDPTSFVRSVKDDVWLNAEKVN